MTALDRFLAPLKRRVALMVGRGVLQLVNEQQGLQTVQITLLADELRDQVERFQNYGFSSHPIPGAEVAFVSVGGSRDHVLVLAVDDRRFRLQTLQQGEVAIYTDEGDSVVLKRGNVIEVTAATKVRLVTPLVEATQDVHVTGNLVVDGNSTTHGNAQVDGTLIVNGNIATGGTVSATVDVVGGGVSLKGHKHLGVTPGSGVSGVPQ